MQGRDIFIEELIHRVDAIISMVADRETVEDDFSIARELAEQLREEVESLQE